MGGGALNFPVGGNNGERFARRRGNGTTAAVRRFALMFCTALVAIVQPACKIVPQDAFMPKEVLIAREEARIQTGGKRGFQMPLLSLGGKFEYSRQGNDEIITMKWDDEKSFRDGALAAAAGLYAWGQAASTKATEETARIAAQEGTKQKTAQTAAELEALKEANRHTEALMEFEAAAPALTPVP